MSNTRSVALFIIVSLPLALASAWAEEATRSWQGPASAAAQAAAAKAAANTGTSANPNTSSSAPAAPATASQPATAATIPHEAAQFPVAAPVLPPAPVPAKKPESAAVTAPATAAAVVAPTPAPPAASAVADPQEKSGEDPSKADAAPAKDEKGAKGKKPTPAKELFGAKKTPAPLAARAIGWYAKGCLSGAKSLAIDGPAWQVMRLSRNRMWGHPTLISLVERLATESKEKDGWPGLLVGDIAQPRGGPMTSGHASHQVGLDADVWLTRMPDKRLTEKEREDLSATSMLAADDISVDPKVFGEGQVKLIKRAASYRLVERVLVHPAIKKALCQAAGTDRGWLAKVRPYWGHYYHMHIRIGCPSGSGICKSQPPPPGDDGCGAELTDWIKKITPKKIVEKAPIPKSDKPVAKKKEITLADLPGECRTVLAAGEATPAAPPVAAAQETTAKPAAKTASKKTAAKNSAAQQ
jgi:penicillin-insensitive murein endopeptidase